MNWNVLTSFTGHSSSARYASQSFTQIYLRFKAEEIGIGISYGQCTMAGRINRRAERGRTGPVELAWQGATFECISVPACMRRVALHSSWAREHSHCAAGKLSFNQRHQFVFHSNSVVQASSIKQDQRSKSNVFAFVYFFLRGLL